jgi:ATP-binding cassette subfamily B protein
MVITVISPIIGLIVGLGATLAIYFGSILFGYQLVEPGDIAAFIAYMSQMLMSLMMITGIFNTLVRAKVSAGRIEEVLECDEDFNDEKNITDTAIPRYCGSLEFKNVTFSYPGSNVPAIKDLSFSVSPGETLAIIGSTGSGKTTICWLALRFYDIDSGCILFGDSDITTLPIAAVRANTSIAPQKPMLFTGSVSENIRWGNKDASDEAVIKVANQVRAAGFIEEMDRGYDSTLGRGGVNISGGQKQRISLARAVIRNAPLLFIDDATSALDSLTEAKVRNELALYPGTKIMVTQRCSAAMYADKILVMENGRRVGFGTHKELIRDCDIYKTIWQSQVDSKGVAV